MGSPRHGHFRRRSAAASARFWTVAALCGALLSGCQTLRSWGNGCPGVYSGVRFFSDQIETVPFDGKVFFILDLPVTAIADTLLIPLALTVDPAKPPYGYATGCRWAEERR